MECNKEEALRAKEIALRKMRECDFNLARKFAAKAQKLFPALENISQLITVCDVHCSTENKINGSENDWYSVLQIERFADEATIKKQYRKLALLLHPDKNKFAGAEAAFKLIGEANRVLTDLLQRSQFDMKCRASVRTATMKPSFQQPHTKPADNKQYGATRTFPSGPSQPHLSFWTCCIFCGLKFQYYREYLNAAMRCVSCHRTFTAYELRTPSVAPGSFGSQIPSQKEFPSRCPYNIPQQGMKQTGIHSSDRPGGPTGKPGDKTGVVSKQKMVGKNRGVQKDVGNMAKADEKKPKSKTTMPKPDAAKSKHDSTKPKSNSGKCSQIGSPKTTTRKRKKKIEEECSESLETSNIDDGDQQRRSSRQKQQVEYMDKHLREDEAASLPPNKSKGSSSSGANGVEMKEATVNGGLSDHSTIQPDRESNAQENSDSGVNVALNSDALTIPDPEFNDFEKDKELCRFAVNQVWALYDSLDGMPRFYARIRKVFKSVFRVHITWLEPDSDTKDENKWIDVKLPVACGRFCTGSKEDFDDLQMFSHQIVCTSLGKNGEYAIHPRKGETWALFKGWDINWSSNAEKHKPPYQFEFVEVLSDFNPVVGINVAYLVKVKGFVSLFQRAEQNGAFPALIPPRRIYSFSHQVPSFKMTGKERKGVPAGSFELDTASLSSIIDEVCDATIEKKITDVEA